MGCASIPGGTFSGQQLGETDIDCFVTLRGSLIGKNDQRTYFTGNLVAGNKTKKTMDFNFPSVEILFDLDFGNPELGSDNESVGALLSDLSLTCTPPPLLTKEQLEIAVQIKIQGSMKLTKGAISRDTGTATFDTEKWLGKKNPPSPAIQTVHFEIPYAPEPYSFFLGYTKVHLNAIVHIFIHFYRIP